MVDYFMKYLNTPPGQSPLVFWVAMLDDGRWYATYWYCPAGNCTSTGNKQRKKKCNISLKKRYGVDDKCFIFAKRKYAVWDNGINPAHYKKSSFSSKWSKREVIEKLTELGFYGNTTTTKKIEKKRT